MSPEERLNRLERVAKLLVVSGRRTRNDLRTNAHKELAAAQKDLAVSQNELAVSQKQTNEKLSTLIEIVDRDRNGKR